MEQIPNYTLPQEAQEHIEQYCSKLALQPLLEGCVGSCNELMAIINSSSHPKAAKKLAKELILCRRMDISVAVGKLIHHFNDEAQDAAMFVEEAIQKGLCSFDEERWQLVVKYLPNDETLQRISLMMHSLPMLTRPKLVTSNKESPFLNEYGVRDSQIYNSDTEEDINLEILNAMNQIPLVINWSVAQNGVLEWGSLKQNLEDSLFEEEAKSKRFKTEKQFNRFKSEMVEVLSKWIKERRFFLTWKVDRRGRVYDDGYLVKLQGVEYQKAIVEVAKASPVKGDVKALLEEIENVKNDKFSNQD